MRNPRSWQARLEKAAKDRAAERDALRSRAAMLAAEAARQVRRSRVHYITTPVLT